VLDELGRRLDVVLMFDVPDEELIRRLSTRTVCERCQTPYTGREPGSVCTKPGCGGRLIRRQDDEPEAIRTRMRAYREQTSPVLDWYRRDGVRFVTVPAVGAIDAITERVLAELEAAGGRMA
jgi:adenylate kinase